MKNQSTRQTKRTNIVCNHISIKKFLRKIVLNFITHQLTHVLWVLIRSVSNGYGSFEFPQHKKPNFQIAFLPGDPEIVKLEVPNYIKSRPNMKPLKIATADPDFKKGTTISARTYVVFLGPVGFF